MAIRLEDNKKELEQKYFLYQFLKEQLDNMGKQSEAIRSAILETQAAINALEEMDKDTNHSALIPLGAGTFVHGKIEATNKVIIAIGSDTVVKEDKEKARQMLEQRANDMENSYARLLKDMGSITAQIQAILPEIESLAGEMNYSDRQK